MAADLRADSLLDPSVTFLNHGSFGSCPRPVFEEYQRWQLELERQPVEFLGRRYYELLAVSRAALGQYLGADGDDLVYTDNATVGVNIALRSLDLKPGDEIVTTDHEYGACDLAIQFLHEHNGVVVHRAPIALPVASKVEIVDAIFSRVTARTKLIYLSHITSFSALIFPVEEICRRAREAGILTLIDGAHAPGQIPLHLDTIAADFYAGNLHKWFCAPKGSGFLHVRPEHQDLMHAAIVSWGWGEGRTEMGPRQLQRRNEWQGTQDPASYLTVPAAIAYQAEHDWPAVRDRCHGIVLEGRRRIAELSGLPQICPESRDWFVQMATCPIRTDSVPRLKTALYEHRYKIEIPVMERGDHQYVRISIQGYNTIDDIDRLLEALVGLL